MINIISVFHFSKELTVRVTEVRDFRRALQEK